MPIKFNIAEIPVARKKDSHTPQVIVEKTLSSKALAPTFVNNVTKYQPININKLRTLKSPGCLKVNLRLAT